ncbi:MAG: glycerol-3-phosphate acyltransferase [Candidatus Marinimicrobia bacterium]|nr:glycerol-3-phosphate acyltransferase [Candidatus Neomarinimicrobiota bacterium]
MQNPGAEIRRYGYRDPLRRSENRFTASRTRIENNHKKYRGSYVLPSDPGGIAAGYLSGSISFARVFAKLGKGVDITAVGNGNPGTANVMREVGKGWAH